MSHKQYMSIRYSPGHRVYQILDKLTTKSKQVISTYIWAYEIYTHLHPHPDTDTHITKRKFEFGFGFVF